MREQLLLLLNSHTNLSASEKKLAIEIIDKLVNGSASEKIALEHFSDSLSSKSFDSTTMNFAPVPGLCPRCGK